MIGEKIVKLFDDVVQGANGYIGLGLHDYCRLETADPHNDFTLVSDNGSMCSIVNVKGSLVGRGEKDYLKFAKEQGKVLHTKFSYPGHLLQIVYDYNPYIAETKVKELLQPSCNTAQKMGFDIENIFDDWGKTIAKYCAEENIYFVLWTKPEILSPRERGRARRKMRKTSVKTSPPINKHTQNIGMTMGELVHQHESFVSMITDAFGSMGIVAETLSAHKSLHEIRSIIDYDFTDSNWKPVLPGDKLTIRFPEYGASPTSPETYLYPSLQEQLFPREPMVIKKAVEIGNKLHQGILLALPPQHPQSFMSLFEKMRDKNIPWRASFYIDANGLKHVNFKNVLAQVLQFKNSTNQRFVRAIEGLEKQHDECIVRFRASFSTWVYDEGEDALSRLGQQVNKLSTAVQSWGSCDVTEMIGDPMLGVASTIPGAMLSHPAPNCAAPLTEVLYMMPMSRPASPWDAGSLVFRTPDGKIIPFHPQSSRQAAWVDLGVSPMGGGKSVFLNTINFGFIFQPGLSELPYLSIIDIGPSSKGLISLLSSLLPEDKKHLVIYERLKMRPEYSINPFDTPLGCRQPLVNQKSYLVNFLCLLATPLNKDAPQDGVDGISSTIIDMAYREFSDEKNPRVYQSSDSKAVAKIVKKHEIPTNEYTTWWELVDIFFHKGLISEAIQCQRYAMPRLDEVASFVNNSLVADQYQFKSGSGENITKFFHRVIIEAIDKYPILKRPTQFDIGSAKIISLDLDEVAPRGGAGADRQTAVMYMLARHVVASKFFLMPTDVEQMPDEYQTFHHKQIAQMRQNPKRLAYDETHRVFRNNTISDQTVGDLETSIRESRKWNLSIGLYSQSIKDYPEILIDLATQIYIFGAGDEKSVENLQDRFGLTDVIVEKLRHLGKPGPKGANMISILKTDVGILAQELTNTLGPLAMWAFSSTTEDVTVRDSLYERIGVQETLQILGKLYPGGVKREIERRRHSFSLSGDKDARDVILDLVNEIHENANSEVKVH